MELPIREISTLAILIPLLINASLLKTTRINLWLFFAFLLFGLVVDLFGWFVSNNSSFENILLILATIYSITEALFFSYWIVLGTNFTLLKRIGYSVIVMTFFWVIYLCFAGIEVGSSISRLVLFDVFYQVAVAFIAGFALLNLIENENEISKIPSFWILTGIFFYCFSTFFIFVIKLSIDQKTANQLWPLHNVVNITTYVMYSIGLWKYRTLK